MRISNIMRWTGLAGALALVAACSDAPTAAPAAVAAGGDLAFAKGGNGKNQSDTKVFTIVPGQALQVSFGNFTLTMSANALCAQNQGYGREFWNLPCALEKSPVTVSAKWSVQDGEGSVRFNRDVRFSPDARVYLSVKANGQWKNTDGILWLEGEGSKAKWVDEGTYDPDMRTFRANGGTLLWRRLKHFSGYNIPPGACDRSFDLSCENSDAPPPAF